MRDLTVPAQTLTHREDMLRGRLIVLEGPDGVGKTTLAQELTPLGYSDVTATLPGGPSGAAPHELVRPLVFISRRQVTATSAYAATLMEHLSAMLWHSGDAPDLSDGFWVSLQATWYTAYCETVLEPALEAGYDVLVDGWYFKFWSKLLLQGWQQHDLDVIFGRVMKPDGVIVLTADVGILYDRRKDFRAAELGMHADYGELSRDTFIDYQQAGLGKLLSYAERNGWPVVPIDPAATIADTAALLAPIVADARSAAPARPPC
jgi:thymidylate kinase